MFLYSSDKYSEVEMLDQMVVVSLIFKDYTLFHRGCTHLHSHQQCTGASFLHMLVSASHPLTLDNGRSGRCAVSCGSDCISLMESGAEHLLPRLWAVCVSSLQKCLCISSTHSSIVFFKKLFSCVK